MSQEPLRFRIREFGARPHQTGRGPGSEAGRGSGLRRLHESEECQPGPLVVHVRDGKPVTARGKQLLEGK